ncbi:hypothetical protein EI94DRAFT_1118391 [Lactarius quietus]|nr:hypothetical protein EI94DRAFT_1118391 [Lactarius quietus]
MHAGSLGEDRTPTEKFYQKVSSHSCRYDIILCLFDIILFLFVGGLGFSFLGGIYLGVVCEFVCAEILGPILPMYLVRRRLGRERSFRNSTTDMTQTLSHRRYMG